MPLIFAAIANSLIGFCLAYMLGLKSGLGAAGIWIGLAIGQALYAGLLVFRFMLLTRRFSARWY